jgi:hypothetical protein
LEHMKNLNKMDPYWKSTILLALIITHNSNNQNRSLGIKMV